MLRGGEGKGTGDGGETKRDFLNVLEKSDDKFSDPLPNICISRVQVCQISIIRKPLKIHIETHECKCTYKYIYFYMFICIFISASFNDEEKKKLVRSYFCFSFHRSFHLLSVTRLLSLSPLSNPEYD